MPVSSELPWACVAKQLRCVRFRIVGVHFRRAHQKCEAQIEALCRDKGEAAVAEFRRQLFYARKTYTVLEDHNHYIDQLGVGQLGKAILAAGRWLAAQERLVDQDDVFWLRHDEVITALRVQITERVVREQLSLPQVSPGDILVAPNAGPLFTPLFPVLGGLILDGGSLGQHTAVTAREYGLPVIIATRHATRQMPNGAWIGLDGAAGTVEIASQD